MDGAGAEDERDAGRDERPDDRAHPGDADASARLVGALEHHERQLSVVDLGARHEREPVPGRPEHEVERPVGAQRIDERRRVGPELSGPEAVLHERQPTVQRAQVEGERAGIDAGNARATLACGAQTIPFAIS